MTKISYIPISEGPKVLQMSSFSRSCLVCDLYGFLNVGKSIFNNSYNTILKMFKARDCFVLEIKMNVSH